MLSFIDIHKAHCADLVYRSGSEQTRRIRTYAYYIFKHHFVNDFGGKCVSNGQYVVFDFPNVFLMESVKITLSHLLLKNGKVRSY